MKFFVIALSIFAVAAAAPTSPPDSAVEKRRRLPESEHEETPDAVVKKRRRLSELEREEINDELGQFVLRYVTAEGTVVSERGRIVPTPDGTGYAMIVEGEISYIGDDGNTHVTKYSLDGYQAKFNHLPVSVTAEPITALEPVKTSKTDINIYIK